MGNDGGPLTTATQSPPPLAPAGDVALRPGVPLGDRRGRATTGRRSTTGTRARRSARSSTASASSGSSRRPASRAAARSCPPRKFCERCFRPTDGWTEVPQTGTRRDVLDLPRHVGHAAAGGAADPGRDPARRHERGRLPAPPGRGRPRRRPRRDGGRGGLEARERAASGRSWTSITSGRWTRSSAASWSRWPPSSDPWRSIRVSADEDPRRALGLVPLHARRGEPRVLRGAARPRRVPRLPLRRLRRDLPAGSHLLRTLPGGARAVGRVRPGGRAGVLDPRPRRRRRPAARSARSPTGSCAWTVRTPSSSIGCCWTCAASRRSASASRAVFAPEREGSMLDVEGFAPADGGTGP